MGNPDVMLPPKNGKLDVGGAVGIGLLQVIKDLGLKEPYSGQTILVTSEIAEDLTYYFANSEQVPSSVGLGVLMEKNNTVRCAGGFIIQMMPFATEDTIQKIEDNLKQISSVTSLLSEGKLPEDLLEILLGNVGLEVTDRLSTRFYCNCSKERVEQAVASIGRKDIQEMIDEGKDIEVKCHFCNTAYQYTVEDLKRILKQQQIEGREKDERRIYQSGGGHPGDPGGGCGLQYGADQKHDGEGGGRRSQGSGISGALSLPVIPAGICLPRRSCSEQARTGDSRRSAEATREHGCPGLCGSASGRKRGTL